jgi:hypothetical protein
MDGSKMVDLGGYVIILVETQDKKVKLYGKMMFTDIETHWPAQVEPLTLVHFKDRLLDLPANI